MAETESIVADLSAESDALDALVAPLADSQWGTPTPAAGWTIAHQIGHLLWTDRVSLIAITDEAGFADALAEAMKDPAGALGATLIGLSALTTAQAMARYLAVLPKAKPRRRPPLLMALPFLALAGAALWLPWLLYADVTGKSPLDQSMARPTARRGRGSKGM